MFVRLVAGRLEHPVGLVLVVEEHDRVGDSLEDGVMRVVGPDDEHLTARLRDAAELPEPLDRVRPVLDRPRGPDDVERVVAEREPLGVASVEVHAVVFPELLERLLHLVDTLWSSPWTSSACSDPLGAEPGATAHVEHFRIVTELQPRERLRAHLLGPGKPVDLVVHLREVFVEQAGVRLVLGIPIYRLVGSPAP